MLAADIHQLDLDSDRLNSKRLSEGGTQAFANHYYT